jgi:cobalt-zinc-cadmium efflux system membrane fusion protein
VCTAHGYSQPHTHALNVRYRASAYFRAHCIERLINPGENKMKKFKSLRFFGWRVLTTGGIAAALWAASGSDHVRQFVKQVQGSAGHSPSDHPGATQPDGVSRSVPMVELVGDHADTLRFTSEEAIARSGVKTQAVRQSPSPQPLRLPGSLFLDPNRLIHVHCRFPGEVVLLGEVEEKGQRRALRFGDRVEKGQLLAVVWSKDIGEKKSELVDALSRLDVSRSVLDRLETLSKGVITERQILDARRDVEADTIAVAKAERTLRSWRVPEEEIEAVKQEGQRLKQRKVARETEIERKWAETEVRAAIAGVVLEKNFNVGDMVDPDDDLLKIADLRRLQVMASVYEEDLWAIRALPPGRQRWKIDLKSDPSDNAIEGTFELIGNVIDPTQRTGLLVGWLDNSEGALAVGQFITASIELPPDRSLVAIPESALIEEGDLSTVFVQTDAVHHAFTRRRIAVVRRCAGTIFVRSTPSESEQARGLLPLSPGEVIAVSGVLGLGGGLSNLVAESSAR